MKKLTLIFIAVLVCAVLGSSFWIPSKAQSFQESTNLFDVIGTLKSQSLVSLAGVSEQEIKFNFDKVKFESAKTLRIPLLDGKLYEAIQRDSEGFEKFADDEFTWRGKILGDDNFSGDVVLTVKGSAVSGLIYSPGAVYEIVPQEKFKHLLVEIDQSRFPECGGAIVPDESKPKNEDKKNQQKSSIIFDRPTKDLFEISENHYSTLNSPQVDDGSIIDVMVVYTVPVRNALGGTTQAAQAFAQQAVATTNTAYQNSGVFTRLRLVQTMEVAYVEGGTAEDALNWVTANSTVATARNTARADLVSIITETVSDSNTCGIAHLMTNLNSPFESKGFSQVRRSCAVAGLSFAHEVGHNQSLNHNFEIDGGSETLYPYAYGYWNAVGNFRTTMSYSNPCQSCIRIPYFSNPSVTYNGFPTGITNQRENFRAINNTALTISQFRDSGGGGGCPKKLIYFGQTLVDSLSTVDCTLPGRGYVDTYTFDGTAGQRVAVSMNSSAFDTYLNLISPSNQILSEDDDGGGGTNSRIPANSGFFTLPATGTYSIYATSFEANKVGAYSISLASESGGQCPAIPINSGQTINGVLITSDCVITGTTKYVNTYTFNGTSGQQIAISMNSSVIDSYLYLYNPSNQKIIEDDDGGGGKNSRIPATNGFYTLPATGTYTIIASSINAGETGAYTISLSVGCSYSLNQTSQSISAVGGNGSTNVTTQSGCNWTAASNASWITVTSGASGSSSGTVGFTAAANTTATRTGTMTIAGQTFTVTQAGQSCSYTINLTNQSFNYAGGSGSFGVSTNLGCAWQAVSNANWITANNSGAGSGTVGFSVAANPASSSRVGTISLAGNTFTVNQAGQTSNNNRKSFDFDGDGKADVSVFRPSNGTWYLQQSQNGFTGAQFGISSDKIVPADYDGDGKTDVAVYRSGVWYLNRSQLGFTGVAFGAVDDIPQPADFDGDGKAELAVWRPSNGTWFVYNLVTNQFTAFQFGAGTDKPVVSDYDGDGKADYAVFRPSNGTWYLMRSQTGFTGIQFGDAADKSVPADYDGDGKTDVAVYRPSNGTWYLQRSTQGFTGVQFGISTDLPTPADYDGDGKADIAVYRDGNWYLNRTTQGFLGIQFGAATDKPVQNAYVP